MELVTYRLQPALPLRASAPRPGEPASLDLYNASRAIKTASRLPRKGAEFSSAINSVILNAPIVADLRN